MSGRQESHLQHGAGQQNDPHRQAHPQRHLLVVFLWGQNRHHWKQRRWKVHRDENHCRPRRGLPGEVVWSDGYSVGYLSQEPDLDETKTVRQIVEEGTQEIVDVLKEYEEINMKFMEEEILNDPEKMQKLMDRQAAVQDRIDALDAWELDTKLSIAMDALRCPPDDQVISELSGGERRRVALCRLLLQQPDVLLLDEPTNHLDAESIDWLEQHLEQYKGTVLCVTHDRYFLDNVAGWILELDRGEGIPYEGNYASWLEQKSKRLAQRKSTRASGARNWTESWIGSDRAPRGGAQKQSPDQQL